jgi:hypothetical protein
MFDQVNPFFRQKTSRSVIPVRSPLSCVVCDLTINLFAETVDVQSRCVIAAAMLWSYILAEEYSTDTDQRVYNNLHMRNLMRCGCPQQIERVSRYPNLHLRPLERALGVVDAF